jgi:hypothetical protein
MPVALPRFQASSGLALELEFGVPSLSELSDARLEDVNLAWERMIAWAQANQARVLATIDARAAVDPQRHIYVVDEVASAMNLTGATAGRRLSQAVALDTRLRATRELWEQGLLDQTRVTAIVEGTRDVSDEVAAAVEARVLPRAVEQNAAQLRRSVKRAVLAVDPEGAQERHDQAKDERRVDLRPEDDGMALFSALVPAADGVAVYESLTRLARGLGSQDPRCMDARRADLLVGLVTGRIVIGDADAEVVRPVNYDKPLVQVVVDSDTLSHRAQHPADLAGYGPITAQAAREIAADGTWIRLVTDPVDGSLLDRGREKYHPSAALADFVRARDGSCMFPGCGRAARTCELDHTRPFPAGQTCSDNLHALCRRHHRLKHAGDWTVVALFDDGMEWTSRTGRTRIVRPRDYRPESTAVIPDDDALPPF